MTPPVVLAIAATDPSGGAGLAADLTTFAAVGVHGTCVVTAVTVQDTTAVHAIHRVPIEIVEQQLDAVLADLRPQVVKTGMLGSAEVVRLVAERCKDLTLVVDPVLSATTGVSFADDEVVAAYRDHLIPVATVATPNAEEHARLGHPVGPHIHVTRGGPIDTTNDHGTGCTFGSALAAHLAHGADLPTAAARAAAYVSQQLDVGRTWRIGRGRGPVAHLTSTSPSTDGGTP
ncbi:bifunctional hydroxymethylpyrimidine kinase/phosphomethylpyrimidine kinase [Nocardioides montaniterrae]